MEKITELAEDIDRRRILRARSMSPAEKLVAGVRLYDTARSLMVAGIRMQHPDATEDEVNREVHRRLSIARTLENTDER